MTIGMELMPSGKREFKFIDYDGNDENGVSYHLKSKISIADSGTYVFDLALNGKNSCSSFAASLSNNTVKLFSIEKETSILTLTGHTKEITGVKYSNENPNCLYSSSLDGTIRCWDSRETSKPVRTFSDPSDDSLKPILSFDFNLSENYLCGGTELIREDAFLVFWDARASESVGGYWNSHTDDITQVKFHPTVNHLMASGSVDGLMNVFDLNEQCEDDALHKTLNTNSSVGKMMWRVKENENLNRNKLVCVTHAEEVQAWHIDEANPYFISERDLSDNSSNDLLKEPYIIDTLQDDEKIYIVGDSHQERYLSIWSICNPDSKNDLKVKFWAVLEGAHEGDTRAVVWDNKDKTVFTGGEDGCVCVWKTSISKPLKMQRRKKLKLKHLYKPY